MSLLSIPPFVAPRTISDDEITRLATIFKPIKIDGKKASLINCDDLQCSFLWAAKLIPYKGDLYTLDRLHTVHTFGAPSYFKPTITEVLQQIPPCYAKLKICYFETVGPEDAQDMNLWREHTRVGLHVAKTTLYLPESTLHLMADYWHEHRDMLNLTGNRPTASLSAVRWLEAMEPRHRLDAMKFFCQKCGETLRDRKMPLDWKSESTPCPKCIDGL